jgi:hypothetical protein
MCKRTACPGVRTEASQQKQHTESTDLQRDPEQSCSLAVERVELWEATEFCSLARKQAADRTCPHVEAHHPPIHPSLSSLFSIFSPPFSAAVHPRAQCRASVTFRLPTSGARAQRVASFAPLLILACHALNTCDGQQKDGRAAAHPVLIHSTHSLRFCTGQSSAAHPSNNLLLHSRHCPLGSVQPRLVSTPVDQSSFSSLTTHCPEQ